MTDGIRIIECNNVEEAWIRQCEQDAREAWAEEFMKVLREAD